MDRPSLKVLFLILILSFYAKAEESLESQQNQDQLFQTLEEETELTAEAPSSKGNNEISPAEKSGDIVIDNKENIFLSYLQRRTWLGILFGVQMERFYPKEYFSLAQNKFFDEFTGESVIPVASAEFGLKYNFSIGSVAALGSYGVGKYSDLTKNVLAINIQISKVSFNFTLDGIMNEPYVAPYVQGGMHKTQFFESSIVGSEELTESPDIGWNFNYRAGLLVQLNWLESGLDPRTHVEGLKSSGLENTYLDIFYAEYLPPSEISNEVGKDGEPDLRSSHFGVGLKMEF